MYDPLCTCKYFLPQDISRNKLVIMMYQKSRHFLNIFETVNFIITQQYEESSVGQIWTICFKFCKNYLTTMNMIYIFICDLPLKYVRFKYGSFAFKTLHHLEILYFWSQNIKILKGALDSFSLILHFFLPKSWDFYTIGSVYLCSDCMLNFTCNFNLIKICEFF